MLVQQEIHDTDKKLIAPWDVQSALRPGTLVDVEVTLIVYSFCGEKPATVRLSLFFFNHGAEHHTDLPDPRTPYPDPRVFPVATRASRHPPPPYTAEGTIAIEAFLTSFRSV